MVLKPSLRHARSILDGLVTTVDKGILAVATRSRRITKILAVANVISNLESLTPKMATDVSDCSRNVRIKCINPGRKGSQNLRKSLLTCQLFFNAIVMAFVNPNQLIKQHSRTAQIEERLNGLVSLLQASAELPHQGHQESSTPDDYDDSNLTPSQVTESPMTNNPPPTQKYQTQNEWHIPPTYNSFGPANCICRPTPGDAPPPPETDDVALETYKTQLQHLYPFVVIPPNVSAATLGATRPFLMSAIRMVTSFRSLRSMRAQMYALKKHISDYVLIRSERSMDLLLGIIVILGWYQYHCFTHAQLHNLLSLAVSLVGELGLNRHPVIHEGTRVMAAQPPAPSNRSNEERRAFIGVWFLVSS